MTSALLRVGFIGLGAMGAPMARHVFPAFPLTLWARRAASLESFAGLPCAVAASPHALAASSDIVALCVTGDDDVDGLLAGDLGVISGLKPGGIVVVHATVAPATMARLAAIAAPAGVALLDAPISGGPSSAAAGRLTCMVGGEPDVYHRALPVLQTYGGVIPLLGPLGSGQRMKLLNNMLGFANFAAAKLVIDAAVALGLERDAVTEVLRASSGASYMLGTLLRCAADPVLARTSGALMAKDARLSRAMCDEAHLVTAPVNDLADLAVTYLHALAGSAIAGKDIG